MYKQALILRQDLNMSAGKAAAMAAHARLIALKKLMRREVEVCHMDNLRYVLPILDSEFERWWSNESMVVVVLAAKDLDELNYLQMEADLAGLPNGFVVCNSTEFNGVDTTAALGIGPCDNDKLMKITGRLPLYK